MISRMSRAVCRRVRTDTQCFSIVARHCAPESHDSSCKVPGAADQADELCTLAQDVCKVRDMVRALPALLHPKMRPRTPQGLFM